MKIKTITLLILAAFLFSPALNCAFAGDAFSSDAFSQMQGASISPGKAFDGSKSYFSGISPKAVKSANKEVTVDNDTEEAEPEPTLWEKTKETIKKQKKNIIIAGAGAAMGFIFGGPAGAVVGAGIFLLFVLFLDL
ncbi:MAG: hypothetical protein U9Q34_02150 [Elusimicrobiota bacterium]|nr:hypothetical protein [Elusimicrobiota bacterium]